MKNNACVTPELTLTTGSLDGNPHIALFPEFINPK